MRFAFIAKHRGIWPVAWMCGALGVSRSGFHAWLTRAPSQRARDDEHMGTKVRASHLGSHRTYGARRVWHDLLAAGLCCGLHRVERLMRELGGNRKIATQPSTGIGSIATKFPMNYGNVPTQVPYHGCDGYSSIAPKRNLELRFDPRDDRPMRTTVC